MKTHRLVALSAIVLGTALSFSTPAAAQARVDTVEYSGPDRGMLRSGVWTLGLSYVPALVVGIESPVSTDRYLFAPVAGPWLDFARRDCPECAHETLNRVLLVSDGVIQGIGTLEILGSFLFTEHTVVHQAAALDQSPKFHLRLSPTRMAGGYGMTAFGNF